MLVSRRAVAGGAAEAVETAQLKRRVVEVEALAASKEEESTITEESDP